MDLTDSPRGMRDDYGGDGSRVDEPRGSPPVVIFIGGSSRSGSTLLDRLLALADGAVSLGEVRFIWSRGWRDNELCGCGTPFRECSFWDRVLNRLRGFGIDPFDPAIDRMRTHLESATRLAHLLVRGRSVGGSTRKVAIEFGRILDALLRAIATESGARFLIDSSKWPTQLWPLVLTSELDLRMVHLVRDPRGVAHSWSRARERPEVHWTQTHMRRVGPVAASAAWSLLNANLERLRGSVPRSVRVRYEEIVRDPSQSIMEIRRLLGLPMVETDAQLTCGGTVNLPLAHSISGNPMRFRTGEVQIRLDDAWRTEQSTTTKCIVSAMTIPLRYKYGYRRGVADNGLASRPWQAWR